MATFNGSSLCRGSNKLETDCLVNDVTDSMALTGNRSSDMKYFTWLVLLVQLFGLSSVVLVAVWTGHYLGGFAWHSNVDLQFNYHPLFMVIGMIFLYADGILAYRVFRNDKKIYVKLLHAGMHIAALVFASVGLKAVFDSHNYTSPTRDKTIPNMYTLHSWIGLGSVVLFALQWIGGFFTFLFPKAGMATRMMAMPLHQYFGMAILCLASASALMGITEKCIFTLGAKYGERPREAYVANFLGVMIVCLTATVIYIVTRAEYKRPPAPDEEHVQLSEN